MLEHIKRTSGGLAAIAIALASASCATVVSGPSQATACSWETASSAPQQSSASSDIVVLVDITASFWPKTGQQLSLPDDPVSIAVDSLLQDFATSGTRLVSFGTFDGSATTIDWKLSDTALPTPTGDSTEIQSEQQSADTCLTSMVKSAVTATPQAPGTDVTASIAELSGKFADTVKLTAAACASSAAAENDSSLTLGSTGGLPPIGDRAMAGTYFVDHAATTAERGSEHIQLARSEGSQLCW